MKVLALGLIAASLAVPAFAQSTTTTTTTQHPATTDSTQPQAPSQPTTTTSTEQTKTDTDQTAQSQGGPLQGANSFTEGQAQTRLQNAGYQNVGDLTKDDSGVWRGKGQKDGKEYNLWVDYKGNTGVAQ